MGHEKQSVGYVFNANFSSIAKTSFRNQFGFDLELFGGILKSITQMLSWPPMKKIILLKTKKIAISKTIIWWYFEVYTTN